MCSLTEYVSGYSKINIIFDKEVLNVLDSFLRIHILSVDKYSGQLITRNVQGESN